MRVGLPPDQFDRREPGPWEITVLIIVIAFLVAIAWWTWTGLGSVGA